MTPPKRTDREKYSRFLSKDEELKLVTGYSPIHLREQYLVYLLLPGAIFIVAGVVIAHFTNFPIWLGELLGLIIDFIIALILVLILNYSHKYLLTTRRIILKEGFLKIKLASVLYDKVTHITVNQGFLERIILGYGTVVIDTAGSSGDELTLEYIHEPIKFKNYLENLIHQKGYPRPLKKIL